MAIIITTNHGFAGWLTVKKVGKNQESVVISIPFHTVDNEKINLVARDLGLRNTGKLVRDYEASQQKRRNTRGVSHD